MFGRTIGHSDRPSTIFFEGQNDIAASIADPTDENRTPGLGYDPAVTSPRDQQTLFLLEKENSAAPYNSTLVFSFLVKEEERARIDVLLALPKEDVRALIHILDQAPSLTNLILYRLDPDLALSCPFTGMRAQRLRGE